MQPRSIRRDVVRLSDLAPKADVKGGRMVFGADAAAAANAAHDNITLESFSQEGSVAGSKKAKDLAPKKNPKGGRPGRT